MHIDDAIADLKQAKANGAKHIVFVFWESDAFNAPDDKKWAEFCDWVDRRMDWSGTQESLEEVKHLVDHT